VTVNEELFDRAIRHAVYLEGLKEAEVAEMLLLLKRDVMPELERRLAERLARAGVRAYQALPAGRTGDWMTKRLKTALKALETDIVSGMRILGKESEKRLMKIGIMESEFHAMLLDNELMPYINFTVATPALPIVRAAVTSKPFRGRLLKQWFNDLGSSTARKVESTILTGFTLGDPPEKIVRTLMGPARGKFTGTGPLGGELRRNVRTVVRTAISHVATHARAATYQANKAVIVAERWVSVLDNRTTDICMSLDGQEFPVGQGPRPPLHHQCRSTTVPVTKSWAKLLKEGFDPKRGARDMRSGFSKLVRADMTYPEWLQLQPVSFQNEILGPTRARLWRSGRVKFDRFFPREGGQRLTLDRLRELEGLTLRQTGGR